MLLTTEKVTEISDALRMLRWYTYRWLIEEYHKILKSGCRAESYRLGGESMEVLLGFLTSIAADLLRMTYLNRTQPDCTAETILTPLQIKVLAAESSENKRKSQYKFNTIAWAIHEIARLGGPDRTQEKYTNWDYSFVARLARISIFMSRMGIKRKS